MDKHRKQKEQRNKTRKEDKKETNDVTIYPILNIGLRSGTEGYIIMSNCYMLSTYFAKCCLSTNSTWLFKN